MDRAVAKQREGHPHVIKRKTPSGNSQHVGKIENGKEVEIIAENGDYSCVREVGDPSATGGWCKTYNLIPLTSRRRRSRSRGKMPRRVFDPANAAASSKGACQPMRVRLLHLSDTHGMHDQIEKRFPLQEADVLLHTGDLTNNGTWDQLRKVNEWFGKIRHRFKHIVVIAGNHDSSSASWCKRADVKKALTNATVLNHEVALDVFKDFGLQIYGSPWLASKGGTDPGGKGHLFHKIPSGIDVLMTHGPARHILDNISGHGKSFCPWGSSSDLNDAIVRAKPRVHLFGHLHEQRGVWQRDSSGRYIGGVEFKDHRGRAFPTKGPPPADWPCDVVSCNAMTSHPGKDHSKTHIAGSARLILAERATLGEPWRFVAA